MMVHYGIKMVALQAATDQATIIMEIPLEYIYAMMPLMGVMMLPADPAGDRAGHPGPAAPKMYKPRSRTP